MAHFAKIGLNNVVLDVQHIDTINTMSPEGIEIEEIGVDYLIKLTGHVIWVKCSFNTNRNTHINGGSPFRKNFPSPGWTYDSTRDAFIEPKPHAFPSWILNDNTCCWEAPITRPWPADSTKRRWGWNETTLTWEKPE